jgi:hypothetical protein
LYRDGALINLQDAYGDVISCSTEELTALALHWLYLQDYECLTRTEFDSVVETLNDLLRRERQ